MLSQFTKSLAVSAAVALVGLSMAQVTHAGPIAPVNDLAETPVPELFEQWQPPAPGDLTLAKVAPVVHKTYIGNGWIEFVQQPDGNIGVGYVGDMAGQATGKLLNTYKATPLEVFLALNDSRERVPLALMEHHQQLAKSNIMINDVPRDLPGLNDLVGVNVSKAGYFGGNFVGPTACPGDANFDLFTNWFTSNGPDGPTPGTNNPSWDDFGTNGVVGNGIASGNANITLLGTTGGAIAFCKTGGPVGKPTLRIAEYIHQVGWVWIWVFDDIMNSGAARGYYFGGYAYRHLRMEIRDAAGVDYFWAGAH